MVTFLRLAALTACSIGVLAIVAVGTLDGLAQSRSAGAMAQAGNKFLASLTPQQKTKASFSFDDWHRFEWHYIPRARKGIPLNELNEQQRKAATEFLKTGVSAAGFETVQVIIGLERILKEREDPQGLPWVRDPELYYFSIFGAPAAKSSWGWRFEGHHVSLNFTIVRGDIKGELISHTPLFLGADPAEIKDGGLKGTRILPAEQDKALGLLRSLDEKQRSIAIVHSTAPEDIITYNNRIADPLLPFRPGVYAEGLAAGLMNKEQRALLNDLIETYLSRMPKDIAAERSSKLRAVDFDKIHFAWAGGTNPAEAPGTLPTGCAPGDARSVCEPSGFLHYYRVQGSTFLIEYDNTNGNHIHTVWRDFNGDFGLDLLREHYRTTPHGASVRGSIPPVGQVR